MNEKELRMRAFCYTIKGRVVTFIELFTLGMLIFFLLSDYSFRHEPAFKGFENRAIEITMIFAAIVWGWAMIMITWNGGAPSLIAYRFFYTSPDDVSRYQKYMAEPPKP